MELPVGFTEQRTDRVEIGHKQTATHSQRHHRWHDEWGESDTGTDR